MPSFIEDGMTYPAHVAAEPGMHDGLTFEFRPMLDAERAAWGKRVDNLAKGGSQVAAYDPIAERIQSWSLTNGKAEPVPVSTVNLLRLQPTLLQRVCAIVTGLGASDPAPDADGDEEGVAQFNEDAFAGN